MTEKTPKKDNKKQMQIRLSQDLHSWLTEESSATGLSMNVIIVESIEKKRDNKTYSHNRRQKDHAYVQKNTMNLIIEWQGLIAPYQDTLRKAEDDDKNRFLKKSYDIYVRPTANQEEWRTASIAMLNVLEGISYGFMTGTLDYERKDTFPIKHWGFDVLLGIQVAFELKNKHVGWPILKEYLCQEDIVGENEYMKSFTEWENLFKKQNEITV